MTIDSKCLVYYTIESFSSSISLGVVTACVNLSNLEYFTDFFDQFWYKTLPFISKNASGSTIPRDNPIVKNLCHFSSFLSKSGKCFWKFGERINDKKNILIAFLGLLERTNEVHTCVFYQREPLQEEWDAKEVALHAYPFCFFDIQDMI